MKATSSVLCFVALAAVGLLPSTSHGQPQNFGPPPQATLQDNGSVVVRPNESIILKFALQDGKIARVTKLPWDTKETEGIIRIAIKREGGVATKLGPPSPITDQLIVWCSTTKPLSARCEYTTLSAPKPERIRLFDKEGRIQNSFRWGVSQVTITEIQFK